MIGLSHYLIVSALIFSIGLMGVLRRRNLLMLFFATEVRINGCIEKKKSFNAFLRNGGYA